MSAARTIAREIVRFTFLWNHMTVAVGSYSKNRRANDHDEDTNALR